MNGKAAARFLEGRFELTDEELRELADELRGNDDAARDLKEQMILDEMLSRHLAIDRRDFCAQVRQRIRQNDSGTAFFRSVTDRIEEGEERKRAVRRDMVGARARRARPVRWGAWVAAAACLAIVVGAVVYNARQGEMSVEVLAARIEKTTPGVEIVRRGETVVAKVGMDIFVGDRMETAGEGRAAIGYPGEETRIDIAGKTTLTVGGVKEGKRLNLDGGAIRATVAPQPKDRPMIVAMKHAEVEVVGTVFNLTAGPRSSLLEVAEGLVRFKRLSDGKTIDVAAGFRAEVREGIELVARPMFERKIAAAPAPPAVETKPVKYADGPVLLQDDLEVVDRKTSVRWNMSLWREGDKEGTLTAIKPTREQAELFVSEEQIKSRGKTSGVMKIDFDALKKAVPAITNASVFIDTDIHALAKGGPVSVEWDEWASPGSGRHYLISQGYRKIKDIYRRDGYTTEALAWSRGRMEIIPLTDTLGPGCYRIRRLGDGVLIEDGIAHYDSFYVGITIRSGKTMIDNVVVKRMVPEKDGDM